MSEQWMGLHNHDRHYEAFGGFTCLCGECEDVLCLPNRLCRCCLAAEVEAQTARAADLQARLTYATRAWEHWQTRAEAAEAQVQRVRKLMTGPPYTYVPTALLYRALDGDR